MKTTIAKFYYDIAKKMYPNETNKHRLFSYALQIKILLNSQYGNTKSLEPCIVQKLQSQ